MSGTDPLELRRDGGWLHVTFQRPEKRNAMSLAMVDAMIAAFSEAKDDRSVRAVILRGAGGHFCSGGDIADMQQAASASTGDGSDAIAALNRRFGAMLQALDGLGAAVVVLLMLELEVLLLVIVLLLPEVVEVLEEIVQVILEDLVAEVAADITVAEAVLAIITWEVQMQQVERKFQAVKEVIQVFLLERGFQVY